MLFDFFSDINSQINLELFKIIRNENKDYLKGGKEIIEFLGLIKDLRKK